MKKLITLLQFVVFAQLLVAQRPITRIYPDTLFNNHFSSTAPKFIAPSNTFAVKEVNPVSKTGVFTGGSRTSIASPSGRAASKQISSTQRSNSTLQQQDCEGISGNISPSNATICEGESVTLTVTGGSSYEWRLNDVPIAGETGSTISVTQPGTYSAIIIEGDCFVPASNTSDITVNPIPTGTISPTSGTICDGGSIVLTATGGDSYTWFRNGDEINGENNATIEVNKAGTYSVTIHQNDCSGSASNTTVITKTAVPTGTISPSSGSFCTGGSIVLTATGGTSYTWFRNGVEINGQTDATLNVSEPGTYSVIINQGDCSGPASNTSVITEASAPSGTISPASGSFCEGGSITLTATGGTSYTWFRNGVEINGEDNATLIADEAGTYSVTIHQGDCSGPASNTSVITLASAPTGTISPATGSICGGGSIVLTATGGTSYIWFRNGNKINGETDATLTVTNSGTYSVTIQQGDCSGPASNTSLITFTSAPTGTISPSVGSICDGGSLVLTATGGTSYTWFRNGVEIAGETDATLNATSAGTYSATIHQGDCSGPASNTSILTLLPIPIGTISPATGSVCEGGSLTLIATGGTFYTWFLDGSEIPNQHGSTLNASKPGIYSAVISQGNCSGPALNTAEITLAAAPTGTISPESGSICEGGSMVLTATGGTSYTWFRDGAVIAGENNATLNVTQAGTYTVTIKQGECTGSASNNAVITLASAPSGTIDPASASICENGSVLLTLSGGTSYIWYRDGAVLAGQNGSTLTVTQAGTYTATINQGNCSGPATNSVVVSIATAPSGTISPASAVLCGNTPQVLTATGGTSYTWLRDGVIINGQESATLSVSEPGTYSVIIKNGNCTGEASNTVVVSPQGDGGMRYTDVTTAPNVPVQLSAREIGTSYLWSPAAGLDNPTSTTPMATTNSNQEYVVQITTATGCVISDTVLVKIGAKKTVIFVPTAFTPDGNGVNDLMRPLGDINSIEYFKVYNRWGQLMFETKQMGAGWDGTFKGVKQPSDTYTWLMTGIDKEGQPIKISGKTFLIR